MSGFGASPDIGNSLYLSEIPFGTLIHNIELRPGGQGGKIARSAGSYAQLMSRDGKYAILKFPSGETRMILQTCKATIGTISNQDHNQEISAKAGRSRWLGRRPRTRGVVMNRLTTQWAEAKEKHLAVSQDREKDCLQRVIKPDTRKASNKYIIERRKKNNS